MFNKESIIYEDNHLLVVNKRSGELVQSDAKGEKGLEDDIKEFIKYRDSKPGEVYLGVVHRIDRPVSGVVIFTKTSKALTRMNEAVKNRSITKRYMAIVEKAPEKSCGELRHFIARNTKTNRSHPFSTQREGAKEAILKYKTAAVSQNYTLLSIELITGRHHQIRCQLSAIGSTIKGDLKYGAARSNKDGSISLHAHTVEFIHPTTKEKMVITAPFPKEDNLWQFFAKELSSNKNK